MIDNRMTGDKPTIEYYKIGDGERMKVPYDIVEISPNIYEWRELDMKGSNFNYGGLVSELVGINYSDSEMTAIINNYLLDPDDEESKREFSEMQECRKKSKEIARRILNDNQ